MPPQKSLHSPLSSLIVAIAYSGNNHLRTSWKPSVSQSNPHCFGSSEVHIAIPRKGKGGGRGGAKRKELSGVTQQNRHSRTESKASTKCARGSSLRQAPRTMTKTKKHRVFSSNASQAVSTKGPRRDASIIAHTLSSSPKGNQQARSDAKPSYGAGGSSAKRTRTIRQNTISSENKAYATAKSGRKPCIRQERPGAHTKRRSWGAGPGAARFDESSVESNSTRARSGSRAPPRRSRTSAAKMSPPDSCRPSRSPEDFSAADLDVSVFLPTWSALVSEAAWLRGGRANLGGEMKGV